MAKAKPLTYEELMDYAKAHYTKGGHFTYECMDRKLFDKYVSMFGPFTKRKALKMFKDDYEREKEIMATIW